MGHQTGGVEACRASLQPHQGAGTSLSHSHFRCRSRSPPSLRRAGVGGARDLRAATPAVDVVGGPRALLLWRPGWCEHRVSEMSFLSRFSPSRSSGHVFGRGNDHWGRDCADLEEGLAQNFKLALREGEGRIWDRILCDSRPLSPLDWLEAPSSIHQPGFWGGNPTPTPATGPPSTWPADSVSPFRSGMVIAGLSRFSSFAYPHFSLLYSGILCPIFLSNASPISPLTE